MYWQIFLSDMLNEKDYLQHRSEQASTSERVNRIDTHDVMQWKYWGYDQ